MAWDAYASWGLRPEPPNRLRPEAESSGPSMAWMALTRWRVDVVCHGDGPDGSVELTYLVIFRVGLWGIGRKHDQMLQMRVTGPCTPPKDI
jgi:hypothetical protein